MVNIKAAILSLATFRQNWCYDEKRRIYTCDFCEFQKEDGTCILKKFVNGHKDGYAKNITKDIMDILE